MSTQISELIGHEVNNSAGLIGGGYRDAWTKYHRCFAETTFSRRRYFEPSLMELMFEMPQGCDAFMPADKLAIYANICYITQKLISTLLRDTNHSYSTCLPALGMARIWPDANRT